MLNENKLERSLGLCVRIWYMYGDQGANEAVQPVFVCGLNLVRLALELFCLRRSALSLGMRRLR